MPQTRLHFIGDGTRYLHEDYAAGIPPIPPEDFDTDDPIVIQVALESGLYEEATRTEAKEADAKKAKADAKVEPEAPVTPAPVGVFPPAAE
jgi:hypothetical protein